MITSFVSSNLEIYFMLQYISILFYFVSSIMEIAETFLCTREESNPNETGLEAVPASPPD
jgi:hypothetical protein